MVATALDAAVGVASTPAPGGRRSAVPPLELIGLALTVVVFWCAGTSFAMQVPPFYGTDERAHLGYAHAVAGGDLPEIDDQPRVPVGADRWRQELAGDSKSDRYRTIWVANHPPLHYVLVAPLVWLARATDRDDGGLRYLRFANLAFAAVGLVFTYLLTVEVSGSRRTGLAAASLLAVLPRGHYEFAEALNDGLGFAAATAVAWAAVRAMRRPGDRAALAVLAGAVAIAAGARAASMLVALAIVGVVALWRWMTTTGSARRRATSAIATAGVAVAPGVLLFGWFYVRNVVVYGDVGASHYLMEWFGRRPTGGVIEVLLDGGMWLDIYQALATRSLLSIPATGRATFVADVAALVVVAGLVAVAVRRPRRWFPDRGTSRDGLTICAAVVAVTAATIAQHVAGGGLPSSRYAFPALGVLACLFAIGVDVVAPRVLPFVVVAALLTWTGHVVPGRVAAQVERGRGPEPVDLPAGVDTALLVVSVVSALALLAVLAATALRSTGSGVGQRRGHTWRRRPWTSDDASVVASRQAAPPEGASADAASHDQTPARRARRVPTGRYGSRGPR